jgi:hypothetical protein
MIAEQMQETELFQLGVHLALPVLLKLYVHVVHRTSRPLIL